MKLTKSQIVHNKVRFGGNRYLAMERDGYQCVSCSMTRAEHLEKFNRDLTVDHIDGKGRYSETLNNDLSNLTTLCLACHGRKDAVKKGKCEGRRKRLRNRY